MRQKHKERLSERGEAGMKLLIILVVLYLVGNAGYNFIPIAYQSENFKQEMQTAVIQGMALPPVGVTPADHIKNKILKAARENNIPDDAIINVKNNKGVLYAQVIYTKKVSVLPFGVYDYSFQFDHTAVPTGYLMKTP